MQREMQEMKSYDILNACRKPAQWRSILSNATIFADRSVFACSSWWRFRHVGLLYAWAGEKRC